MECDGTPIVEESFAKIERVAEASPCYCLWMETTRPCCCIYNAEKQFFVRKSNTFKLAETFCKIECYSSESKSFVAYGSDNDFVHIIFDDGSFNNYNDKGNKVLFDYVGEEHFGMRPVRILPSKKWVYFDSQKKTLAWSKDKGYDLKDGVLGRKLSKDYYLVCYAPNYCKVKRYDNIRHKPETIRHAYQSVEECECPSYYICKLYNKELYELVYCSSTWKSIGCYAEKPIYDAKNNVYYARRERVWCIIKDGKELFNYQWENHCFLFKGGYIFYHPLADVVQSISSHSGWKIFDGEDAEETGQWWKNIRLCDWDTNAGLLVDTEVQKDIKIFLKDLASCIGSHMNDLIARSKLLSASNDSVQTKKFALVGDIPHHSVSPTEILEEKEEITLERSNAQSAKKEATRFQCENHLPSSIKYCTSIDTPEKITSDGYLQCNRKCAGVLYKEYICWIVPKSSSLIVTEYIHKTHKVIFYKTYEQAHFFEGIELPTRIVPITLEGAQEDTLIEQLEEALDITIDTKYDKVYSKTVLLDDNSITESPKIADKQMQLPLHDKVCFTFNDKGYALNLGEVWDIENVFDKKKYLLKNGVLAILLSTTNLVSIEYKQSVNPHYKIIGVGNDLRFDQDFVGPINKVIRDNARQILLFKRENDKIYLVDEVRCCACTIETQILPNKDKERKVILFDLVSLRQVNEWHFKR